MWLYIISNKYIIGIGSDDQKDLKIEVNKNGGPWVRSGSLRSFKKDALK